MFQIKNILGHTLSTIIGVVLTLSIGVGMFLCVHYKYATFGEVMPYIMLTVPPMLAMLYAPSNDKENV